MRVSLLRFLLLLLFECFTYSVCITIALTLLQYKENKQLREKRQNIKILHTTICFGDCQMVVNMRYLYFVARHRQFFLSSALHNGTIYEKWNPILG